MNPNTAWRYNDLEFELDMQDVETVERYEAALEAMGRREVEIPSQGPVSTILREYCNLYIELFNDLLGIDDARERLFGGKLNAAACEEAYDSLLSFVKAQAAQSEARRSAILAKYSPDRAKLSTQK